MALPLLPLVLLGAGTAISAWGKYAEGESQANAANQAAALRDIEAQEVLERLNINRRSIFEQGERFKVRQRTSIAKQGRMSDDSTLSMLEDTNAQVVREIYNVEREAKFRAQGLRTEAELSRGKAGELRQAGMFGALETVLTAGFKGFDLGLFSKAGGNKTSSLFTGQTYRSDYNKTDIGKFGMYA